MAGMKRTCGMRFYCLPAVRGGVDGVGDQTTRGHGAAAVSSCGECFVGRGGIDPGAGANVPVVGDLARTGGTDSAGGEGTGVLPLGDRRLLRLPILCRSVARHCVRPPRIVPLSVGVVPHCSFVPSGVRMAARGACRRVVVWCGAIAAKVGNPAVKCAYFRILFVSVRIFASGLPERRTASVRQFGMLSLAR